MVEILHHTFTPTQIIGSFKILIGSWYSGNLGPPGTPTEYVVSTSIDGVTSTLRAPRDTTTLGELRQLWFDSIDLPEGWSKQLGTGFGSALIDIDLFPPDGFTNMDAVSVVSEDLNLTWRLENISSSNLSSSFILPETGYIYALNTHNSVFIDYDGVELPFEEDNYYESGLTVSIAPLPDLMPVVIRFMHVT